MIQKIVAENLRSQVMERYLACLTDKEIEVIEKYMEHAGSRDGFLPEEDETYLEKFYAACYIGSTFDGKYIIPQDVAKNYEKTRESQYLKENRGKISYLLCCLRTASLLYGVMPFSVLMEMLAANQEIQMTESEVREYWEQIPIEYMDFLIVGDKVYHRAAYPDDGGLQKLQGDKEFYIPTKEEILEMGVKAYLPSREEMRCFVDFLVKKFKIPEKHAEVVAMRVQRVISGGGEMYEVYEIFDEEEVLCTSKQQVEELVVKVNDLWSNTRMVLNRGYTPKEMSRLAIKRAGTPGSNIISFEQARKKKVYPNDPCPCGSGKKYKNCCGKKL